MGMITPKSYEDRFCYMAIHAENDVQERLDNVSADDFIRTTCAGGIKTSFSAEHRPVVFIPKNPITKNIGRVSEFLNDIKEIGIKIKSYTPDNELLPDGYYIHIDHVKDNALFVYSILRMLYRTQEMFTYEAYWGLKDNGLSIEEALAWSHYAPRRGAKPNVILHPMYGEKHFIDIHIMTRMLGDFEGWRMIYYKPKLNLTDDLSAQTTGLVVNKLTQTKSNRYFTDEQIEKHIAIAFDLLHKDYARAVERIQTIEYAEHQKIDSDYSKLMELV